MPWVVLMGFVFIVLWVEVERRRGKEIIKNVKGMNILLNKCVK